MADSRIYEDWLAKARTDLESARILFEHGGDYATVAFHCQQAIEKGLKGFILKSSKQLKDGHSLIYLCRKASQAGCGAVPVDCRTRPCAVRIGGLGNGTHLF